MRQVAASKCREPSDALRHRSSQQLRAALADFLVASEPTVAVDFRDVLVGKTPFYDCAERLGIDPVALFDEASRDLEADAKALARDFARRSDIDLESFGWSLIDTPEGPCYRPTG